MTTIKDFAAKHGIAMSSKFVGIVQRDGWTAFKFKVTLKHGGKSFTTSYSKGCGHLEQSGGGMLSGWKRVSIPGFGIELDELGNPKCLFNNGKFRYRVDFKRTNSSETDPRWEAMIFQNGNNAQRHFRMSAPDVDDVLDCLIQDGSVLFQQMTFEDFCMDYGYESDSRKAYKIYKKCLEIGHGLNKLLGAGLIRQLIECERL